MKKLLLFIFVLMSVLSGWGQEGGDEPTGKLGLTTIAQINQGTSYITVPTLLGNIEPLWFEARLVPAFYIRSNKKSRWLGVINPEIIIRMYQEHSFPVRTPSYMPSVTLYYLLNRTEAGRSLTLFGRLAHHSNGQQGDFYLDNGDINFASGNFSTNYAEAGILKTYPNQRFDAINLFGVSLEAHPAGLTISELWDIYSRYRLNAMFAVFVPPDHREDEKGYFSAQAEASWMMGNLNGWNALSLERLTLSLTLYYHPAFLEDIGVFATFYHGLDYYNIQFNNQIDVFRIGIMTEKLNF